LHITNDEEMEKINYTSSNNNGTNEAEKLALQIVSYIGCAISIVCLVLTIIFLLGLRYAVGFVYSDCGDGFILQEETEERSVALRSCKLVCSIAVSTGYLCRWN